MLILLCVTIFFDFFLAIITLRQSAMGIYIPIADCRYTDDVGFCRIAEGI